MSGGLKAQLSRPIRWSRTEAGAFLINWLGMSVLVIAVLVWMVLAVKR